jgi:O-antigen/teichoic acid export membrane protein
VGLSIALAGTQLVDDILRWRISLRLLPSMKVSPFLAKTNNLGEFVRFGIWNSVLAGSVRLISYSDSLVIATFMPIAAVAPFAVAANLRSYFEDIFVRVGYVFFPAVTQLDAQGNLEGLRKLYMVSSKFMFLGSILCGSIALYWSSDFFRLWVGTKYAEPVGYPSIATIFYLLLLGSIVSVAQRIGYQVMLGVRRVRLLATLFVLEAVCNLLLSLLLVRSYGLLGIAIGTLVPAFIVQGFLQPWIVCRFLHISLNTYCRNVLMRPALSSLALAPLYLAAQLLRPQIMDWPGLVVWVTLSGTLAGLMVLWVGLDAAERNLVVVRPLGKLFDNFVGPARSSPPSARIDKSL